MDFRKKYGNQVSLERKDPSPMSELVPMFLKLSGMTSAVNENLILSAWDRVTMFALSWKQMGIPFWNEPEIIMIENGL